MMWCDFDVRRIDGGMWTLTPNNDAASEWMAEFLSDERTMIGPSVVIERGRYLWPILEAIDAFGLSISSNGRPAKLVDGEWQLEEEPPPPKGRGQQGGDQEC
jgi:hypothetical protein